MLGVRKLIRAIAVIIASVLLASCGGGSSSSGADSSPVRVYEGTAVIAGSNTCGRSFPKSASMKLTTNPDSGIVTVEYLGEFKWGDDRSIGGMICVSCINGQTISGAEEFTISADYSYAIQGQVTGSGASVFGWHGISGKYGNCAEGYMVTFSLESLG